MSWHIKWRIWDCRLVITSCRRDHDLRQFAKASPPLIEQPDSVSFQARGTVSLANGSYVV